MVSPYLVEAHLVDFPALLFLLIFSYAFPSIWKSRGNILSLVRTVERKVVLQIVENLEHAQKNKFRDDLSSVLEKWKDKGSKIISFPEFWIFSIGSIFHLYFAIAHPAPFGKFWFDSLIDIKNVESGQVWLPQFTNKGFSLLMYLWVVLTQTQPEILLHIVGSILWGLLLVIIYKIFMTFDKEAMLPALIGIFILNFVPDKLFPFFFEYRIEANSDLILLLYFSMFLYVVFIWEPQKYVEKVYPIVLFCWAYSVGFINLFYFIFIFIPGMLLLSIFYRKLFRYTFNIVSGSVALLSVHSLFHTLWTGEEFKTYIKSFLYNPQKFSFYPNLIYDFDKIPYFLPYVFLITVLWLLIQSKKNKYFKKWFWLFVVSGVFLLPYYHSLHLAYNYVDLDQLSLIWNIIFPLLLILFLYNFKRLFEFIIKKEIIVIVGLLILVTIPTGYFLKEQWKIGYKPTLNFPLPNEFYKEYYVIIQENIPWTYAIVAPQINASLAVNRHYFMNYNFFLHDYGKIDSLYHEVLILRGEKKKNHIIPPASIYVFVKKPPYKRGISQIFYPEEYVMQDIIQWINKYKKLKQRTVKVYSESKSNVIFEIVNIPNQSHIWDLLLDTQ